MSLYSKEILRLSKTSLPPIKESSLMSYDHRHDHRHEHIQEYRLSNPICGDRVVWRVVMVNGRVQEAWYQAKGCALCKASSALLYDGLVGESASDVVNRVEQFVEDIDGILIGRCVEGEALLFNSLPIAKARKECVVLSWKALQPLLSQKDVQDDPASRKD
jgi:nitrogen fixation protein NifU and related proteins